MFARTMTRSRSPLRLLIAIITLLVPPSAYLLHAQSVVNPGEYLLAQSEEGQVWVNTATGIYHYPGTPLVREDQTRQDHERERRDSPALSGGEEWTVSS